jgi:DNA-binding NarL/FixJ family response regulator
MSERSPAQLRVLVVDDHDVVHWGFRLMLTQQSWVARCVSAHSGAEALTLAARYHPHVALVDLFIGEESGAEVCELLRAQEPGTRVLLFSGAGDISRPGSPPRTGRRAGSPRRCGGSVSGARCSSQPARRRPGRWGCPSASATCSG